MTTLRQAAQQALEALEAITRSVQSDHQAEIAEDAITALRTALEQQAEPPPEWPLIKNILAEYGLQAISFVAEWKAAQQQAEPIGWLDGNDKLADFMHRDLKAEHDRRGSATPREFTIPVYTTPPQRQWVGLTDEDWEWVADKKETSLDTFAHGAAWAADQLKERNK